MFSNLPLLVEGVVWNLPVFHIMLLSYTHGDSEYTQVSEKFCSEEPIYILLTQNVPNLFLTLKKVLFQITPVNIPQNWGSLGELWEMLASCVAITTQLQTALWPFLPVLSF